MERKLPTHVIEGTAFIVDVANRELRESGNASNSIPFSGMEDHGTHYSFDYHKGEKNIPDFYHPDERNIVTVTLLQMRQLDPKGMAEKYGLNEKDFAGKSDVDIIAAQPYVQERLQGILPRINIAGSDYIIDVRLHELRKADDPMNRIALKEDDMSADGQQYRFFYDLKAKRETHLDDSLTRMPRNVVLFSIPNDLGLDPIGFGRRMGMPDRDILQKFPPEKTLPVKETSLSETGLSAIIQKNKEALNRTFTWPRLIKRRRGKGM